MTALLLALALAAARPGPEMVPPPAPPRDVSALRTTGDAPRPWDSSQEQAIQGLMAWLDDPVLFVRSVLGAEPDAWQIEALQAVARDPRVAMCACKGPGKSCLLAWVAWWFLATRVDAQIIVTSVTGPNLKDGLWKELATWYGRSQFLQRAFDVRGERIVSREHPKTWWISARTWAQDADATQQANTLAGFHATSIMIILDEVGDYPDGVVVAAEGIFANGDVDAHLVVAGNPTRTDGPLYRIATRDARRWTVIYITGDPDAPNRSPRISLSWAQQQIEDWGRENDWVRINVLGLFPRIGSDKILGPDDITRAEGRKVTLRDVQHYPVVFGLDVAREGDDRSVLIKRQGPAVWAPLVWRGLDGTQLADRVASVLDDEPSRPDYFVIDKGGPGYSAYDRLRLLGWEDIIIGIDFGGAALDQSKFIDRRAEIWVLMARHVREACALPVGDGELRSELTGPTVKWDARGKRTAFILESKKDMKKRGLPSPDKADALACTYAAPRHPRANAPEDAGGARRVRTEDDVEAT